MFVSLDIYGAYIFWAMVCAFGFVILGLWAPETKGIPMEQMEELFSGRWWMGWRARQRLDQKFPTGHDEKVLAGGKGADVVEVEKA